MTFLWIALAFVAGCLFGAVMMSLFVAGIGVTFGLHALLVWSRRRDGCSTGPCSVWRTKRT